MASKTYKLGKVTFKSLKDKQLYIIRHSINELNYIGKESKLSPTEIELKKLIIRDLIKLKKSLED